MLRKSTTLHLLLCGLLALASCDRTPRECPTCPNNTRCNDGDCGCGPDQNDMGSWCLQKHDNLFVSANLDCPCLEAVGLYLTEIKPETGNTSVGLSSYDLVGRGKLDYNTDSHFSYFQRAGGDSIAMYNIVIPGSAGYSACKVSDNLFCEIDLHGKFHGPDTIKAEIFYRRCRDNNEVGSNYEKMNQVTFVRKK